MLWKWVVLLIIMACCVILPTSATDSFNYTNGQSDYDFQPCWMKFDISGNTVINGVLEKEGVCKENTHLTKTELNFSGSVEKGPWEGSDENATIVGIWTGGDSSCGKQLTESDGYPQSGTFTIYQEDGQVILKRAGMAPKANTSQYLFPPLGKTSSMILSGQTSTPSSVPPAVKATVPTTVPTTVSPTVKTRVPTTAPTTTPPAVKTTIPTAIPTTFTPTVKATIPTTIPPTATETQSTTVSTTIPSQEKTDGESITKSIILLFDASGSMEDNSKIGNAKSAAKNAIRDLSDTIEVALIVFSDCEKIEVTQPFTTDKNLISTKIDQVQPYGSTPLGDAIDFANDYKKNARSADRTVVLFTDGIETCR